MGSPCENIWLRIKVTNELAEGLFETKDLFQVPPKLRNNCLQAMSDRYLDFSLLLPEVVSGKGSIKQHMIGLVGTTSCCK